MAVGDRNQVERDLAEVIRLTKDIWTTWDWADGVGHQRDCGQSEKVRGAGVEDPVGEICTSRFHSDARGRMREAARACARARTELVKAMWALQQNVGGLRDYEDDEDEGTGPPISKKELEEAQAAQRRRWARGERTA